MLIFADPNWLNRQRLHKTQSSYKFLKSPYFLNCRNETLSLQYSPSKIKTYLFWFLVQLEPTVIDSLRRNMDIILVNEIFKKSIWNLLVRNS